MVSEFRMPSLGPDMEAGTLVEWRIKPGDAVKRGDVVALVETDKGIIDVEIFTEGIVKRLLVERGARVPVGTVLAELDAASPVTEREPSERIEANVAAQPATERRAISPAARTRAQALGIDVSTVRGSGPEGSVTLRDVETCVAPGARPPDMRQTIAKSMTRAKREIPHYYLLQTCDFEPARRWLDQYNASVPIEERMLPIALLIKAVALAARAHANFNGHHTHSFTPATDVNVGVAIALRGGGLVAPAIFAADTKPLPVIMRETRDLTTRVRAGHMRSTELTQATITVTSLADDGPDSIIPVILPPQVAMVGFGSIAQRPVVTDDTVKAALTVTVTLAADHRVTNGRQGSRFLAAIRTALTAPERL